MIKRLLNGFATRLGTCAYNSNFARKPEMDFHAALMKAMECMGLRELKPKQLKSIESFMSGRDTFVSLPTGYGKSIIFGIFPL